MLTALRTRWEDSDLAAQLRYVGGWVSYGNPAQAYTQLIYLFQGFVDLCNQHNIEYWLDWGSLLGYLRHNGGVIPCTSNHALQRALCYEQSQQLARHRDSTDS
jgi:hypothetical protein